MNSLSDLISNKSEDLFGDDFQPATSDDQPTTTVDQPTTSNDSQIEEQNNEMGPEANFVTPSSSHNEIDTVRLKTMIHGMKDQLDSILRMLNGEQAKLNSTVHSENFTLDTGERIVEGVFNGEKMVGPDGKEYSIPPNYASKSKLVEGDLMKLTITNNGSFIYKQIQPIERKRITGELVSSEGGQWSVLAEGKTYKVLTASVTFYKGKAGDEVIILVPYGDDSNWGAVENIVPKLN